MPIRFSEADIRGRDMDVTSEMILRRAILLIAMACWVTGCDESVSLDYATRADAEADKPFARGWLPEIIPASSRDIAMRNDPDSNISSGTFAFDRSDYEGFVTHLRRESSQDEGGSVAFVYQDWIFWIEGEKNRCRFHLRLGRGDRARR
jgi:hypothetical protein